MPETHPTENFVPENPIYLMLGSFPPVIRESDNYDWFYGSKRNQFWRILENVYGLELKAKEQKQDLFAQLRLAITDIIYQCERKNGNSLDNNLVNIIYNSAIDDIVLSNKIKRIYFTSKFVEKEFKKNFRELVVKIPHIELITLPSPSPRYARMTLADKISEYKKLLPNLS